MQDERSRQVRGPSPRGLSPDRARALAEGAALVILGALGVALGARAFAPTEISAKPAPEVTPPEGGWPEVPAKSEHVADYVLSAKLDPVAHTIEGKGTITLHNVSDAPLQELRMHLYLNAFKNDRSVFRRARVSGFRGDSEGAPGYVDVAHLSLDGVDLWPKHRFVTHQGESPQDPMRGGDAPPIAGAPTDETDVSVPLPNAIAPGASASFEIEFHDQLPEVSERTGYQGSFHFAGQWFPKLARLAADGTWASFAFHHVAEFYADYGVYDVTVDVPEAFTIGGCGHLVSSKVEGGRRIETRHQEDVHDSAWTAWDRYVVREAREGDVQIHLLSPPGYDAAMDRELASVQHGLRDFGARFGAYPYADLTVVHPPDDAAEAGGMEYPTLITTGGPWWPAHGTQEIEGVTVHELGHQWFYGLIGTNEVEWPSGDEGFNSFGELSAEQRLVGNEGTLVSLHDLDVSYLAVDRGGADPPFDEPVFQPAYDFATGSSYGTRIYAATATSLETLHRTYGAAAFDAAMGTYTRRFRFQHPTPADFFATLDEVCGQECGAAARAALTSNVTLDYYVYEVASERAQAPSGWFDGAAGRTKREDATEGSWSSAAWIGRHGAVDLPVEVELRFADGSRRIERVRFGEHDEDDPKHRGGATWRRIDADGPVELVAVVIDPELKIPLDRTRTNNFKSTAAGRGGAPVTRERALAWIETLARQVGP